MDECLTLCKTDQINVCNWVSYSPGTKQCYGLGDCEGIQNYYDYLSSQVECAM